MSELRESEARRAWRDLLGALAEIDADWIGPQRGLAPGREHLGIRGLDMALWGAVDIAYSAGEYELAPDEALVMEGRLPKGLFANVVIWNELGQTADYLERTVSLNDTQMAVDESRRYRVVIVHRDPGVPNWLDTCGEPRAAVFWRFMLPSEPLRRRCAR